ncbi:MAG TPA: HAD-IA family hydrolase [Terracidiphilus sp.]|nr:HAD-IA family hydrolase [Terracidiphilus sp.]
MIRVLCPLPVDSLKLLVFDLDGTLIDSAQDLCNSVNATLVHFGRPALPDEIIAGYIGDGSLLLVNRALSHDHPDPFDEEFLARAHHFFLDYYREHKLDYTCAYDGVLEALEALRRIHDQSSIDTTRVNQPGAPTRSMAVLTNKPVRPALAICQALGLAPYFLNIYGGNSFSTKKPDPEGLFALMQEAGARPEETVMIGDSQVDIQTARNAGAWSVGCTFGLAPETLQIVAPDILVDSPAEWTPALTRLQPTQS